MRKALDVPPSGKDVPPSGSDRTDDQPDHR
jgi:hypothetical protein